MPLRELTLQLVLLQYCLEMCWVNQFILCRRLGIHCKLLLSPDLLQMLIGYLEVIKGDKPLWRQPLFDKSGALLHFFKWSVCIPKKNPKANTMIFWELLTFFNHSWAMSSEQLTAGAHQYRTDVRGLCGIFSETEERLRKLFQFSGSKIHFLWKANCRFARLTIMASILKDRGNREHFQLVG